MPSVLVFGYSKDIQLYVNVINDILRKNRLGKTWECTTEHTRDDIKAAVVVFSTTPGGFMFEVKSPLTHLFDMCVDLVEEGIPLFGINKHDLTNARTIMSIGYRKLDLKAVLSQPCYKGGKAWCREYATLVTEFETIFTQTLTNTVHGGRVRVGVVVGVCILILALAVALVAMMIQHPKLRAAASTISRQPPPQERQPCRARAGTP